MLDRYAAQGLTDILAAAALGACAVAALRRGIRSPLGVRIVFAFGGLALFFVCRGAAEISLNGLLTAIAEVLVTGVPVAGLVLAEGLLRRHAPWPLKAAITLGALVMAVALILSGARQPVSSWGLGLYNTLSLLALVILLLTRDRTSLSHQENGSIDALLLAGAALTALNLTDFFPGAPIGLSGLGAALLSFFTRAASPSPRAVRRVLGELSLIALAALGITVGLAKALALNGADQLLRLGAVVLTLMIALDTLLSALRDHAGEGDTITLRNALAQADTRSLGAFLDSLEGQPLLRGLRVMESDGLAEYGPADLADVFAVHAVWTRSMLRDADTPRGVGHEELLDLMTGADASHAALISRVPLRIALLTLPEIGPASDTEADLRLFRKLATIAAETAP